MQFYVMNDLRTSDWTFHANAFGMKPEHLGLPARCPVCTECVGSLPWLPPYHAEIVLHGRKLGDIIKCSGDDLLVSARFHEAWLTAGLRGISQFSAIERLRVRPARFGRKPLAYFHIHPQYFGTRIDLDSSLIDYDRGGTCKHCHSGLINNVRRLVINESSWTGEDLFFAWGKPGSVIVSDRVRELRDKHGLTNMNLTRVEEYLWDPEKRWTPYCYYLPEGWTPPPSAPDDSSSTN